MPKFKRILSVLRVVYCGLLPVSVREPLYKLRHRILGAWNLDLQSYPYVLPQAIPHSMQESASEQYPLNVEGLPTALASIVPPVDSRPQPGIPERMIVGNPPREQLYL